MSVGPLLRQWRQRRHLSQLDLALEAGVSPRHVSFLETGRSRPSQQMVLHLAEQLDVPLRERNAMLLAAGFAPAYEERALEAPEMEPVRDALRRVLEGHDPHPAFVVDRHWNVLLANRGAGLLLASAAPHLLAPPANAMRLALHPDGVASRILNFAEWRAHLLERLERQVAVSGDEKLAALLQEVRSYPSADGEAPGPSHGIFVPMRIDDGAGGELSFLSTIATFGTAVDITVAELSIESFFPADARTAEAMRRALG